MSDFQGVALIITSVTGLIAAIFSGFAAIYAAKAKNQSDQNGKDIRIVEKATNSMKDALVQATGDAKFLEGQESERRNPQRGKPPYHDHM